MICVEMCSRRLFHPVKKKHNDSSQAFVQVKNPCDCIGCKECEIMCPDLAITVESHS